MQDTDPLVLAMAMLMLFGPVILMCLLCRKCCCRKSGSAIEEAKEINRIRAESLERITKEYKTVTY